MTQVYRRFTYSGKKMRPNTWALAGISRPQLDAPAFEDPRAPFCLDRAASKRLQVQKAYLWKLRKLDDPIFPELIQGLLKLPELLTH